jgi:hypothetical protein
MNYQKLSDKELYATCKKYGYLTLEARRKFAGTLPEVNRRKLHRKYNYASIYEFAAKLAGMSHASVDRILKLSEKIADKPALKRQLEKGEQGWAKIEKVAYISTSETDKKWAEKVNTLSAKALDAYVKEVRKTPDVDELENKIKFTQGNEEETQNTTQNWSKVTINMSPEVEQKLRLFKQENKCLTLNETLKALLATIENEKINQADKRNIKIQVCPDCAEKKARKITKSRYIPADVRRVVQAKYKGICVFPNCNKPATSLHHCNRFTLKPNHEKIVPLCDAHENLVHAGLVENENKSPEKWRLLDQPNINDPKFHVDQAVTYKRSYGRMRQLQRKS